MNCKQLILLAKSAMQQRKSKPKKNLMTLPKRIQLRLMLTKLLSLQSLLDLSHQILVFLFHSQDCSMIKLQGCMRIHHQQEHRLIVG